MSLYISIHNIAKIGSSFSLVLFLVGYEQAAINSLSPHVGASIPIEQVFLKQNCCGEHLHFSLDSSS